MATAARDDQLGNLVTRGLRRCASMCALAAALCVLRLSWFEIGGLPLRIAGYGLLAAVLVAAPALLAWLRRSHEIAVELGCRSVATRRWLALAWFVPLVNLVLPFRIARTVWTFHGCELVDGRPVRRERTRVSRMQAMWVGAWVFAAVTLAMPLLPPSLQPLRFLTAGFGCVYLAACCLLAVGFVRRLDAAQQAAWFAHASAAVFADEP
ncbi:MAG TPA: DUF4328 domain-containing protein [Planctomycetota bacterium]|nr:DUF4328 domain-containing protein [Planctomycetota bacterium]